MKRLLIALLEAFGLVTARRYRFQAGQLREAEARAKSLAKQVSALQAEVGTWKTKAAEAQKKLKATADEVARHTQRVEKFRDAAEKAQKRDVEVEAMYKRLVDAERELIAAREHLMAVEVKLDILEGAANVLDARTRTAIARQTETGAPA